MSPSLLKEEAIGSPDASAHFHQKQDADDLRSSQKGLSEHRFSRELRDQLRELQVLDNYHGLCAALEDWFFIACAISLSLAHYTSWSIYFVAILVIGSRHRALATLLHESSHKILTKNPHLNLFLGSVVGGWPIFQSWSVYVKSHVHEHHHQLGHPEKDPDYAALIDNGLYGSLRSSARLRHYIVSIFIDPRRWLSYLSYLFRHRMYHPDEFPPERMARLSFMIAAAGFIHFFDGWSVFFWYWIVPALTTANWVGSIIELVEHYPLMEIAPSRTDIYLTRNRIPNGFFLTDWLLGMHEEHWHLVHHLFPKIPFWNQPYAHQLLMSDEVYRSRNQTRGWPAIISEMLRQADYPNPQINPVDRSD